MTITSLPPMDMADGTTRILPAAGHVEGQAPFDGFEALGNPAAPTGEHLHGPDCDHSDDPATDAAPWGFRKNGQPKAKPGARATGAGRSAGRSARPATAPRRSQTAAKPTSKPAAKSYVDGLLGIMALPAAGLIGLASVQKTEDQATAYLADAAIIHVHGEALAVEVSAIAEANPTSRFAQALDRICQAGPYGALLAVGGAILVQGLVNHKILPPGIMGSVSPEAMAANLTGAPATA